MFSLVLGNYEEYRFVGRCLNLYCLYLEETTKPTSLQGFQKQPRVSGSTAGSQDVVTLLPWQPRPCSTALFVGLQNGALGMAV